MSRVVKDMMAGSPNLSDAFVEEKVGHNAIAGGFSSHCTTRAEMPCTMIRLNLVKGLSPILQITEGWTVMLPDEVSDQLMERTNSTWLSPWSRFGSVTPWLCLPPAGIHSRGAASLPPQAPFEKGA